MTPDPEEPLLAQEWSARDDAACAITRRVIAHLACNVLIATVVTSLIVAALYVAGLMARVSVGAGPFTMCIFAAYIFARELTIACIWLGATMACSVFVILARDGNAPDNPFVQRYERRYVGVGCLQWITRGPMPAVMYLHARATDLFIRCAEEYGDSEQKYAD